MQTINKVGKIVKKQFLNRHQRPKNREKIGKPETNVENRKKIGKNRKQEKNQHRFFPIFSEKLFFSYFPRKIGKKQFL